MRVTFFQYLHKSYGSLVQVSEFSRAFQALGHELAVHAMDPLELKPSGRQSFSAALKGRWSKYLHEPNALLKNLAFFGRECRIVAMEKPDVILTRYKLYYGSSALTARRFRIPLVLWMHAPHTYEEDKYLKKFRRIPGLAEWVEKRIINAAKRTITVSEEVGRYFPEGIFRNGHLEVIPNGVDPEKFNPSSKDKNIRSRFPVPNPVILGFVGSFAAFHGIQTLKSILAFTLSKYRHTCFLLVGEGPRRSELEEFVRAGGWEKSRVHFTGRVDHSEVPNHVAAMDICLLPYDQESEGFYFSPLKLFEYMAGGKPVLGPRMGQVAKVIKEGFNGMLYAPASPADANEKLRALIDDASLRQRLGETARKTILENYTWRHTALAVERVLKNVLGEHRVIQ